MRSRPGSTARAGGREPRCRGHGTDQELLKLETRGSAITRRGCSLNVCIGTTSSTTGPRRTCSRRLSAAVLPHRAGRARRARRGRAALERRACRNFLQERRFSIALASPPRAARHLASAGGASRREAESRSAPTARARLCLDPPDGRALSKRRRAPRGAAAPEPPRARDERAADRAVMGGRELRGIPIVDLRSEHPKPGAWSDLLLDASGHLNGYGHQVAAAAIRRSILAPYLT